MSRPGSKKYKPKEQEPEKKLPLLAQKKARKVVLGSVNEGQSEAKKTRKPEAEVGKESQSARKSEALDTSKTGVKAELPAGRAAEGKTPGTDAPAGGIKAKRRKREEKPAEIFFATIEEICKHFKLNVRSYKRRNKAPGYPRKLPQGYAFSHVEAFLTDSGLLHEGEQLNKDQELAAAARQRRITMEFELDRKKGKLIARDEHARQMRELAEIFLHGLEVFVQQVGARMRKDAITVMAEKIRDNIRTQIASKIRELKT
jgi:hypothetical protein